MATYYIDPDLGSDSYSAAQAQNTATPWKTWAKASASGSWVGGNSFRQKAGTTTTKTPTFAAGGSSEAARITIGKYGEGANPVVDGRALRFGIQWYSGYSYITIQDFTINNVSGSASGMFGISGGGGADCDYVTIERCVINTVASNGSNDCDGIWIKGNYAVIRDCQIYNIADDGIWVQSTTKGPTITNCRIVGVAASGRAAGDCIQLDGASNGFRVSSCYLDHQNSAVKQNFIVSSATAATVGGRVEDNILLFPVDPTGGTSVVYSDQPGIVIQRNIISGARYGITLSTSAGQIVRNNLITGSDYAISTTSSPTGMLIENNTFADCTTSGPYLASADATSYVRNNVFYRCVRGLATHGSINKSKNSYFGNTVYNWGSIAGGGSIDSDAVTTDPLLSTNYKPRVGSPLIEGGDHLGYFRDIENTQRQNPPTIGAYEYPTVRGDAGTRGAR